MRLKYLYIKMSQTAVKSFVIFFSNYLFIPLSIRKKYKPSVSTHFDTNDVSDEKNKQLVYNDIS